MSAWTAAAFAFFLLLALAPALRAQSVRWEPAGGTLAVGQVSELGLVCENCEPKDDPVLPRVPGLTLELRGRSQNISMVNFNVTKSVTLNYAVRLERKQRVEIPAFDIETDKGRLHVPAARFEPGEATVGQTTVAVDTIANSHFTMPSSIVWAGEVFPLTYTLSVARRYFHSLGPTLDWVPAPLAVEDWSKAESSETIVNGEPRLSVIYRTRAYAPKPGVVKLQPGTQSVNLITGYSGFGLFQNSILQQQSIASDQPELNVRPLPQPAPAVFNGAVGQFKLTSKVVPDRAGIGEPITWTVELAGTGNWPDIAGLPVREVSKDFEVVQPQAKRTTAEGKLFDVTLSEDVVLMPTRPGSYTLGPLTFAYFDPKSGSYKTLRTDRVTVTVVGDTAPKAANGGAPAVQPVEPGAAGPTVPKSVPPPAPPAALPGDPLPGAGAARAPWSAGDLLLLLAAPVAAFALFWGALALQRAFATDPLKAQRAARGRLRATLAALASADRAQQRELLHAWRRDTAVLWQITHAAPTALAWFGQTGDPGSGIRNDAVATAWSTLWRETDRALYGADGALPADWLERAEQALAVRRVPAFSPVSLLRPRNLLPWWFALVLLAAIAAPRSRADAPADYRQGDFAAAENAWRAQVAQSPTDWVARHNLGLALIQQDKAAEAAAQWTAAFVQHPGDASTRRHFLLGCDKAGYIPTGLNGFETPGPEQLLAQLASPAEWQLVLVAAVALAAIALGLWLVVGYGRRARWLKATAWSLLAAAVLVAVAALVSLHAFGLARDSRAALAWRAGVLRSIPTEADTTQKTTALAPGSLGVVDRTFLGWVRLSFANGDSGWVRKEDLVMLWQ